MSSLYKKMHQVMMDSEAIEKNMTVGDGGKNSYKAVSEAAVLNAIKPLLKKHGLVIFPVGIKIQENFQEYEGKYGITQRFISELHAKYKLVDIDTGEFEILETVGYGADSQDKGSGKAMTYAYKALIQKTFCLFSGEDTDNEHSDDIEKKNSHDNHPQQPANLPPEWQKQAEQLGHAGVISVNQAKRIFAIAGGNEALIKTVIKKYGYTGTKDITLKDYNQICTEIEKGREVM